ncbi:hypothetical protein AB1287_12685 [Enterobacter asburiae]|uniref:hypothetical protein n=1 Tax=unclassified Scandinavium TaxID=2830652 RepID=UPI002898376D|nr:hypothetical protein [Scandinavium sp.]
MRDFDMHEHRRGHGFGSHRMAKPLVIGAVIVAVLGLLVMSLWNALLPALVGVKAIGFWQALGLLVLCRILFGGLGFRPGMFGMRRRMHERWMQMTPEQREAFMQHRREGFGRRGHHHHDHCGWRGRRDERMDPRPAPDASTTDTPDSEPRG